MMQLHLEKIEKVEQVIEEDENNTDFPKVEDFWAYLVDEMVPSLYNTKWYNVGDNPDVSSDKQTKTKVIKCSSHARMGARVIHVLETSKTPMCSMTTRCWGCRGDPES